MYFLQKRSVQVAAIVLGFFLYVFPQTASADIKTGLIGYWKFNEMTGTTALDSSGFGRNGTLTNGPTWVPGKLEGGLQFVPASNTYVAVPDADDSKYTGAITLSAWIYLNSGSGENVSIMSKNAANGGSDNPFDFRTGNSNSELTLVRSRPSSTYCVYHINTTVGLNSWHHVAVTEADGNIETVPIFYIDGTDAGSVTTQTCVGTGQATGTGHDIWIGRRDDGAVEMAGYMDEARIYNRALSAADIAQLYNFRSPSITRPANNLGLTAYYSFNEGTSTDIQDYSGNGYKSTLVNGVRWGAGKFGKGLVLDGTDDYMELPAAVFGNYPTSGSINNYDLTFSTWFKTSVSGVILGQDENVAPPSTVTSYVPALYVDTSGYLRSSLFWHSGFNQVTSSVDYRDNKWHNVTVVCENGGSGSNVERLYVDGVYIANQVFNEYGYTSIYKYFLGASYNTSWPSLSTAGWIYFNGSLDETRIYNRPLSAAEVAALYKQGNAIVGGGEKTKVANGLIAYFPLNGSDVNWTSGTAGVAYDRSGQGNNGTITNMNQQTASVPGKLGQALDFDGVDDYVSFAGNGITTNTITFSAWVKGAPTAGFTGILFSRHDPGSVGIGYYGGTTYLGYTWNDNDSSTWNWYSGLAIPTNEWAFVAVAIEPTKATAYLCTNGTCSSAVNSITHINQTLDGTFNIGFDNATRYFDGSIDDARIYNRTLSAAEIRQLYSVGQATIKR